MIEPQRHKGHNGYAKRSETTFVLISFITVQYYFCLQ